MSQPQQQEQTLSDGQVALLESFVAVLSQLSNIDSAALSSNLSLRYPDDSYSFRINSCLLQASMISQMATNLLTIQEIIPSAKDWENIAETINGVFYSWKSPNLDISSMLSSLKSLTADLSGLIQLLPETRRFIKLPLSTAEATQAQEALKDFVQIGKDIIKTPEYKNSKLDKLDQLLFDVDTVITREFGRADLKLNRSFVALAAPSMEGKTQSAFTLRRVKPLYFPLSEANSVDIQSSQAIYKNFHYHALWLKKFAEEDLLSIDSSKIGSEALYDNYNDTGLWTLGYLKKIVELSKGMDLTSDGSWMLKYANLDSFSFVKASIASIESGYFVNFCLFLDEYSRETWAVFVRNLGRTVGIKSLCANTNTKIANIVGLSTGTGGSDSSVWSIVVTSLNSPSEKLLNDTFQLENSIEAIKARSRNAESLQGNNSLCNFLEDFQKHQLKHLRPGVAVYIAKALKLYTNVLMIENTAPTLGRMMDYIIAEVSNDLISRKPSLNDDIATFGKIALLFPENYYDTRTENVAEVRQIENIASDDNLESELEEGSSDDDVNDDDDGPNGEVLAENGVSFSNQCKFLEEHLFYLHNPQAPGKWMFLTFPPRNNSKSKLLRVPTRYGIKPWKFEYTHFESSEILTMLACLFIHFSNSVQNILLDAQKSTNRQSSAIYDSSNSNAFRLPGNPLEVSAAVSVVDSTQHTFESHECPVQVLGVGAEDELYRPLFSFSGQMGAAFICNLIVNLISDSDFDIIAPLDAHNRIPPPPVRVKFHNSIKYNLETAFLDKLKVPFLYGVNRSVPIIDSCCDPSAGFFVRNYIRTEDNDQIDGEFEALFNGLPRNVVVECKHWKNSIGSEILEQILFKALNRGGAVLSLVFCTKFTDPRKKSSCVTFCKKNKINVFHVKKHLKQEKVFFLVPFFDVGVMYANPSLVCIILESLNINKRT